MLYGFNLYMLICIRQDAYTTVRTRRKLKAAKSVSCVCFEFRNIFMLEI